MEQMNIKSLLRSQADATGIQARCVDQPSGHKGRPLRGGLD